MSKQNQKTPFGREHLSTRARRFRVGREECANISTRCAEVSGRAEVLFLGDPALSERIEVHAVIEDALASLPRYLEQDYSIVIEPFETSQGRCAILQDSLGNRLCIFDRRDAPASSL